MKIGAEFSKQLTPEILHFHSSYLMDQELWEKVHDKNITRMIIYYFSTQFR